MRRYLTQRGRSFAYAAKGIVSAFRAEANMRIHLAAAAGVLLLSAWLGLARWEWVAVLFAIGFVWMAELINTAIEDLTDLASPDLHPLAGRAKDLAAGAVLIASLTAALVGAFVFVPRLLAICSL